MYQSICDEFAWRTLLHCVFICVFLLAALRQASFFLEIKNFKTDVEVTAALCLLLPIKWVETNVIHLLGLEQHRIELFSRHVLALDKISNREVLTAIFKKSAALTSLPNDFQAKLSQAEFFRVLLCVLLTEGRSSVVWKHFLDILPDKPWRDAAIKQRDRIPLLESPFPEWKFEHFKNVLGQAERLLDGVREKFQRQTADGVFSTLLETELSDAVIHATKLLGVCDVRNGHELMVQFGPEAAIVGAHSDLKVCELLNIVRGMAVVLIVRRCQMRYQMVIAINKLMGKHQERGVFLGLLAPASRIHHANIDEFEKVPALPGAHM